MSFSWDEFSREDYFPHDDVDIDFFNPLSASAIPFEMEENELNEIQERELVVPQQVDFFLQRVQYLFDEPSPLFPVVEGVRFPRGDTVVPLADRTGYMEQTMQFAEASRRTFNFLGLNGTEKLVNVGLTPRRGVEISPDLLLVRHGAANLLVLDARSPREYEAMRIKGSFSLWRYWNVEEVYEYLWNTATGGGVMPRYTNLNVVVVGEQSALRAVGLYRTISLIDQLISLYNGNGVLGFPELYVLSGGIQALVSNLPKYAGILEGTTYFSQLSMETSSIIEEKLEYYKKPPASRYDEALLFGLIKNPMGVPPSFFGLLSYYTLNPAEYRDLTLGRKENPFLTEGRSHQRQRIEMQMNF
jgi:rhodanese-related sulfurtransferase